MKTIYLLLFTLFTITTVSGLDIKLQKNKIFIDGKEVGTTEKFNNKDTKIKGYIFSDKEGNNKLYFEKQMVWGEVWYVVRPDFMTDTTELKHEYLRLTFNEHAALTELLVKKYDFYGQDGMRLDVIREYINTAEKSAIANRIAVLQEKRLFQRALEKMT